MRILLSNDDGVYAPGILELKKGLETLGEVFLIAPERPRSASGHSITLHKPLRIEETVLLDGSKAWSSNGTPSDCVTLGYDVLMEGRVDLVMSGINAGPNLGWDLTYSGTVAAAIEGCILGSPAVAISVAGDKEPYDFSLSSQFARLLAVRIRKNGLAPGIVLNVNVPQVEREKIKGVAITHQGRREYTDRVEKRIDPWGRAYYWVHGTILDDVSDPESDVHMVMDNWISVTPIHLDLTANQQMDVLKGWDLSGLSVKEDNI